MSTQRIGILGGTFDPVHFGHLRPALELAELLDLNTVRMLPCHRPTHRGLPGATTEQRVHMLRLAIDGVASLEIDTRECARDAPSYSVDTLISFREEYADAQLVFFMGMDAFNNFTHWHRWEQILKLAHLVVVPRPGAALNGASERLLMSRERKNKQELTGLAGGILLQRVAQFDVSATRIRDLASRQRNIRYLLPEPVREYIRQEGLYTTLKEV